MLDQTTTDLLPLVADAKREDLSRKEEEARALVWKTTDDINELMIGIDKAQGDLRKHERNTGIGVIIADHESRPISQVQIDYQEKLIAENPIAKGLVGKIKRDTSRLTKLRAHNETFTSVLQRIGALNRNIEKFIHNNREAGFCLHGDVVTPKLQKNETISQAIERLRECVTNIKVDRRKTITANLPSRVVKGQVRGLIQELALRGQPDMSELLEGSSDNIAWPIVAVDLSRTGHSRESGSIMGKQPDTLGLLAWLFQDRLIAGIDAEIDKHADDTKALDPADRNERAKALSMELLAVERQEEALIERAEREGLSVVRRAEADPLAVLGLAGECSTVLST